MQDSIVAVGGGTRSQRISVVEGDDRSFLYRRLLLNFSNGVLDRDIFFFVDNRNEYIVGTRDERSCSLKVESSMACSVFAD